jgi:GWxTD domain-containing protein
VSLAASSSRSVISVMSSSILVQKSTAVVLALSLGVPFAAFAQKTDAKATPKAEEDPLNRQLTPEQKKKAAERFKKEVGDTYKKWLQNDVLYIITDEEVNAFKQLATDEERDNFIEDFWLRRDPTPDTVENEAKEEHYRRIAYANEHFAAGKPGWKTDRGMIYIRFGAPDQIDSHPSGGTYNRPIEEGGGQTSTYPFEVWRYRYLEGQDLGNEVEIEFVDKCMCGAYDMTMDRSEKDALLNVPGAGQTLYESLGMADRSQRYVGGGFERIGPGPMSGGGTNPKMFERLAQFHALQKAQPIKFKDLQEVVRSKIRYNTMPFDLRVDYVKVTEDTALVPITVQVKNKDITFDVKDGVAKGTVNIFGQLTTLTNRIAQTFEDTVSINIPEALIDKTKEQASVYWKAFPLKSGQYKLSVVVKDVGNGSDGRLGTSNLAVKVPRMGEDTGIMASSLIIADQMEKVPTGRVGTGNFVIGDTKVRPRLATADGKPATFKKNQMVSFWMQVYNLGLDETTKKSDATIEYEVVNTATNKPILHAKETTKDLGPNTGEQITLAKSLQLEKMEPGLYQVTIRVNDNISKQTLAPQTARFAVEQ